MALHDGMALARARASRNQLAAVTKSPSFSIIMPTYQRRDIVCEAVLALSRLEYDGAFELIVVVNGSTDGTAEALASLDSAIPMRIIEIRPNRGPAPARNRGAAEASGDLLIFLDDDMICQPDLLQQHARFHAAGADVVTGEIPVHPSSEPGFITDAMTKGGQWKRQERASAFDLFSGHFSIRRPLFAQVGGFDEEFGAGGGFGGEDVDLGVRLSDFDIRHNSDAVAWQKNLITPLEHMRRARLLAAADLRVLAKHPGVAAELLWHRGLSKFGEEPLAYRLSRVPLLAPVAAAALARVADMARRTRFRSNPGLARFYFTARSMAYWSAFRTPAGKAILHRRGGD
jgi:glycosyltransferase involved in cell wall biosynthesis